MVEYIQKLGHIDLDDVSAITEPKKSYANSTSLKIKIIFKGGPILESDEMTEEVALSTHEKLIKAWLIARKLV